MYLNSYFLSESKIESVGEGRTLDRLAITCYTQIARFEKDFHQFMRKFPVSRIKGMQLIKKGKPDERQFSISLESSYG